MQREQDLCPELTSVYPKLDCTSLCYGHNSWTVRVKLLDVYIHASTITICLGLSFFFFFSPGNFFLIYVRLLTISFLGSADFFALSQLSGLVHIVAFEDETAALLPLAQNF